MVATRYDNFKLRMYIDFTNLNNVYSKDFYLIPPIVCLVDSTAGHVRLCFFNRYSGYHQIRLKSEDEDKSSFICDTGTYYYVRMSFVLENVEATYQRLMDEVLEDQINRNLKVYNNDIIFKSKEETDSMRDIEELFARLRKYDHMLNPDKCVFGLKRGRSS